MQIEGAIYAVGDSAGFTREAWCQLVSARPEFRRHLPRSARNPFSGETTTIHAPPDAADVVVNDQPVGKVFWSMSEEPLVNVSVESSILPLVNEWAAAMGGEFRSDPLE